MDDPFKNMILPLYILDDTYSDFFPKKKSEEVRKVVERYIKKTKPFFVIKSD
jgi:hypothetical protein